MSFADVLMQLLAGWLIADFLSGLLHWLEDRVLSAGMPFLGKHIVVPNRLHHADPAAFIETGLWSRNSTTWPIVAALALAWLGLWGFSAVLLGAFAGGLVVNEVHWRAHRNPAKAGVWAALQEIGIVQSGSHHWRHHKGQSDSNYCVLTDWLNPVLDRLGFWSRLEDLMGAIGLEPNRGTK